MFPEQQQQKPAQPREGRPVFLSNDLHPVEVAVADRAAQAAQRRQPARNPLPIFRVGLAEARVQILLFGEHDGGIEEQEDRQGYEVHRPPVVHDRETQNDEQVPDVKRIAAVREHASVDERVGPHLAVLTSSCDVDETDDEHPQRLTGERDEQPDRVRHVIDAHVATHDPRPCAEPDQQQHQR